MEHKWTRRIAIAAVLAALALPGCGGGVLRVCHTCQYKATVTFNDMPTGTINTANMRITVKHPASCPQPSFPNMCTEELIYNVKCKLGTARTIVVPFFIDALPSVTNHTAEITVVQPSGTTVHTGTINQTSNVNGGGPPPTSMPTPCAPPTLNPYTATGLPTVQ